MMDTLRDWIRSACRRISKSSSVNQSRLQATPKTTEKDAMTPQHMEEHVSYQNDTDQLSQQHVEEQLSDLQRRILSELSPRLSKTGLVALPSSAEFEDANLRFTEYHRPTYSVVVRPATHQDVVEAVNYARTNNIPFAARSGHHCVTTTMSRLKDGLLIDMRALDSFHFDAGKRRVTAGGGVLLEGFTRFVHSLGMEVTVGSCPTVGLMGVSLGAGLGRLQGKYGYLNDNMISCKLLIASGEILEVSQETNPDLFWALRGAGHNFGIALEATFQVYPQTNGGKHHTWDMEYHTDQCVEVFEKLNDVHKIMPAELAIFVLWRRISAGGQQDHVLVNLVYSGPAEDAKPWVAIFQDLKPVYSTEKLDIDWPELPWETYGGQNKELSRPEVWKLAPNKMMAAVGIKEFDPRTTKEFFEAVKEISHTYKGKGWFSAMFECLPHHRTKEIPDDATAFPWRHGTQHHLMLTATPISTDDTEAFEAHLEKWKATFLKVSGYDRLQQYVNYGSTTSRHDPVEALYGYEPWRLEKLRKLKKQYDPDNLFSWYQPLEPIVS